MDLLPMLGAMWRRRVRLTIGFALALVVGIGLGTSEASHRTSAIAWTAVRVDTPKSVLVRASAPGAITLPWRASLLAAMASSSGSTRAVAQRLGMTADQLTIVDADLAVPQVATATAQAAAKASDRVTTPYVVTVFTPDPLVPRIGVQASAPNAAAAQRLAGAMVTQLRSRASPGGPLKTTVMSGVGLARLQPFVIDPAGPMQVKTVSSTSLPKKAIVGGLLVLVAWWGASLLLPGGVPHLRRRRPVTA